MKTGLFGLNFGDRAGSLTDLAARAEELGYDSLWFGEHLVLPVPQVPPSPLPPETQILEPLVAFAAAAAVTSRIELATGIVILPQRNPVVLAKQVGTLDAISRGRFTLGIGVGYLEAEMSAVGVPMRDRGRRSDEYLAAMRRLWTEDAATFSGEFVSFSNVAAYPQPTGGRPRVVVGGHGAAALRRAVSSAHGWFGWFLRLDEAAHQVSLLRALEAEIDRPAELGPLEIVVTPRGRLDRASLEAYANAGVDHVVLLVRDDLDERETLEFMERHAP